MTESDLRLIREAIFDPRAFLPRLDEVRELVSRMVEAPPGTFIVPFGGAGR